MKKILFSIIIFITFTLNVGKAQTVNFQWAKQMGDISNDRAHSVAIDAAGNVYTTGRFEGMVDFDPGAGTYNLTSAGWEDVFVSKLNSSGTFVWAKQLGGANFDVANSIAVDAAGNIYTTGSFLGTSDFDPGLGVYNLTSIGSGDIFVSKLNSSGAFVWAKNFGGAGSGNDAKSIAVDATGNVYTTGYFDSIVDFDPGISAYNLSAVGAYGGSVDVFISKLNASGNFVWAKQIGGGTNSGSIGNSITVDAAGNVYSTGWFADIVDFDPGVGVYNIASSGTQDIFVSKLNSSGAFVWAKSIGGSGTDIDIGSSIVLDASGNVYTTGGFSGTADFDPGVGVYILAGGGAFVSKLNVSGTFVWAKRTGIINSRSIALDASANVYTTGDFLGTADFDPGVGVYNLIPSGVQDIFVSKLNASGAFVWAKQFGGAISGYGIGTSIAVDGANNIYTTGCFVDTVDFDPGVGTYSLISAGFVVDDIFVHKMCQTSCPLGISELPTPNSELTISPNPNNGQFTLLLNNDASAGSAQVENGEIILINSIGQKVFEQKIIQGNNNINTNGLAKGLYDYLLLENKQQIKNGKLVVE